MLYPTLQKGGEISMKKKMLILATVILSIIFGTGFAYALFTSNVLSISNNSITAGEAAIKFCDTVDTNAWTTNMNPATTLAGMVPGEEREVYGGRNIFIGNDGGQLANVLGSGWCTSYQSTVNNSTVSLRIVPNLELTSDTCPTGMADTIQLRLTFGSQSLTKTISAWAANTAPFDAPLLPNAAQSFHAYAQYDTTATTQAAACNFNVHFTGLQTT
jgi:hypothetical protein